MNRLRSRRRHGRTKESECGLVCGRRRSGKTSASSSTWTSCVRHKTYGTSLNVDMEQWSPRKNGGGKQSRMNVPHTSKIQGYHLQEVRTNGGQRHLLRQHIHRRTVCKPARHATSRGRWMVTDQQKKPKGAGNWPLRTLDQNKKKICQCKTRRERETGPRYARKL